MGNTLAIFFPFPERRRRRETEVPFRRGGWRGDNPFVDVAYRGNFVGNRSQTFYAEGFQVDHHSGTDHHHFEFHQAIQFHDHSPTHPPIPRFLPESAVYRPQIPPLPGAPSNTSPLDALGLATAMPSRFGPYSQPPGPPQFFAPSTMLPPSQHDIGYHRSYLSPWEAQPGSSSADARWPVVPYDPRLLENQYSNHNHPDYHSRRNRHRLARRHEDSYGFEEGSDDGSVANLPKGGLIRSRLGNAMPDLVDR